MFGYPIPWRLVGAAALITAAFFAGWQVNGWRLGKQVAARDGTIALKQQIIDEWKTAVSARDTTISLLQGAVDSANTVVSKLENDNSKLKDQLTVARGTIEELQAAHDAGEGAQLGPLPAACDPAVREFALRLGALP